MGWLSRCRRYQRLPPAPLVRISGRGPHLDLQVRVVILQLQQRQEAAGIHAAHMWILDRDDGSTRQCGVCAAELDEPGVIAFAGLHRNRNRVCAKGGKPRRNHGRHEDGSGN